MSMRVPLFGDYPIPADTYRTAHASHPSGTRALQLREHFGVLPLFTVDNSAIFA